MKCRTKAVGLRRLYPAFLNAVLLNWFSQDLTQIYGHKPFFGAFVRNQNAFYGQTAIFDHFVRNRHFLIEPFTDRRPIFIDMSVNDSDFSKYSAHSVSTPSHQSKLPIRFASGYFHHGRRLSCIRKKAGWFAINCKSSCFSIWDMVFSASSPIPITHQAIFSVKLHFYFNFKNIFCTLF